MRWKIIIMFSSLSHADSCHKETSWWTTHLQLTSTVQPVYEAWYEVNLDRPCLFLPLIEGFDRLICYQIIIEIQFKNSILKSDIKFPVGVGKIRKKSEISIEIPWWSEVYDIETRMIGVKNRVSWLNNKKNDQSRDSKQDYKYAKDQTDDSAAPNGWICSAVVS